jgi:hypothetical protein
MTNQLRSEANMGKTKICFQTKTNMNQLHIKAVEWINGVLNESKAKDISF